LLSFNQVEGNTTSNQPDNQLVENPIWHYTPPTDIQMIDNLSYSKES
jgi:hypothetical protein